MIQIIAIINSDKKNKNKAFLEVGKSVMAQNYTKPAMALVSVNWRRFARQKVPSLEHTSACHGGHVPWHIQPCTHYTLA